MNGIERLFTDKEQAIKRMNSLGKERTPFFFLTDFGTEHCLVEKTDNLPTNELQFAFPEHSHISGRKPESMPEKVEWETYPQPFETYSKSFDTVQANILAGNSFLTNLTCATPVRTNMSLEQIFSFAEARYKLWLKDRFTVFSPETFVRIHDGFIYSCPMKGTIDACIPDAREKLVNDVKERAEHATITDLIRNDLSQSATEVTVTRFMYLEKLTTNRGALWQMSSEIRGRLASDYRQQLGDIIFRMLPAGSVSGAPKKKTVDIIHQAENYNRGFYTGVMGYFDGENLDSAVLIRFIEQDHNGKTIFKSGGGITFQSNVRSEYEEMKQKVYVPIY